MRAGQLDLALAAFTLFALTVGVGVAISAPAYARLLRLLAAQHPEEYAALGSPTLWNGSPTRSLALQRFLYRGSRAPHIDPEIARASRFLGIFTPAFVALVLAEVALMGVLALRTLAP